MLTFAQLEWAAFYYWAASYGKNIGGDQDYIAIFEDSSFCEIIRHNPEELDAKQVSEKVIGFLNKWGCRIKIKGSGTIAQEIKKALVLCKQDLRDLEGQAILNVRNGSDFIRPRVESIYDQFNGIQHFGPTASSKLMHILQPDLFVMWDAKIVSEYHREHAEINSNAGGYFAFLSLMSQMANEITVDFRRNNTGDKPEAFLCTKLNYRIQKTLAKFLDEYNWIHFTKGLPIPPQWCPHGR